MDPRNATSFLVDKMEAPGRAGAIMILRKALEGGGSGDVVGFNHACPCGCGKWSFIRLNAENWAAGTVPIWDRTGDDLHMTLKPSIGIKPLENGRYHWHGYLENGVFIER